MKSDLLASKRSQSFFDTLMENDDQNNENIFLESSSLCFSICIPSLAYGFMNVWIILIVLVSIFEVGEFVYVPEISFVPMWVRENFNDFLTEASKAWW